MRKQFIFILSVLLCACLCTAVAFAADGTVVYVRDGGTGDGTSAVSPLGTLDAAISALGGRGGTVVACGNVTVSAKTTVPEQSGDLTLTGEGGKLVLKNRFQFAKNTNSNQITLDLPIDIGASYDINIFGGFNNLHLTEKCTVTSTGGGALNLYGGMCGESGVGNAALCTELPYTLTVDAGTFAAFSGGNFRQNISYPVGSIAAPVTLNITGGTFGTAADYDIETNNKSYHGISV